MYHLDGICSAQTLQVSQRARTDGNHAGTTAVVLQPRNTRARSCPLFHHCHLILRMVTWSTDYPSCLMGVHPTRARRGSCLQDNYSGDSPVALVAHQVAMTALPLTASQPQVWIVAIPHLPVHFAPRSVFIDGVRTEEDSETSKGS